jgi:hypothetical protein
MDRNQNGEDLRGRDLSGLDLRGYAFNGADLRGANLHGANLEGVHFNNADLRDADFSAANAKNAHFAGANVYGTNFSGTVLTGADLGSSPTAVNDSATAAGGESVQVDVLRNDVDATCPLDPSSIAITSAPRHGTVHVNADHTTTYTPKPGFTGTDQFTYRIANLFGKTDQATVKIVVS